MSESKPLQAELGALEQEFGLTLGLWASPLDAADEAVCYNARTVFPAASTIKLFLLAALLNEVAEGRQDLERELTLSEEDRVGGSGVIKELWSSQWSVRDLAMLMIIVSDNTATNVLIDLLSVELVQDYCLQHGWEATRLTGKLMVGRSGPGAASSPRDLADCMSRLWRGQLLPVAETRLAQEILLAQQYTDQLGRELDYDRYSSAAGADDLLIASKTGSIRGVRNDVGVVMRGDRAYVLGVMTKDCSDTRFNADNAGSRAIMRVSKLLHDRWLAAEGSSAGGSRSPA